MKKSVKTILNQSVDRYALVAAILLCCVSFVVLAKAYTVANPSYNYYKGARVGSEVRQGAVVAKLVKVRYENGSGHFAAPNGMRYMIATLLVKNASDAPITIAPTNDTYVKTASGEVSYVTPYALKAPFKSGQLLPGEQVQGELSYIVKTDAKQKYYLESDWSGGVVSYLLQ